MANPTVVHLHPSPWQLIAKASDRIAVLVTCIPGWDGYKHSPETLEELRYVATLLHAAIPVLERASEREVAHG